DVAVIVPGLHTGHVRLDDGDPGLDQPPGQEQRLTVRVPAVSVADRRWLLRQVERVGHLAGRQDRERPLVLLSHRRAVGERGAAGPVDFVEKGMPALHPARAVGRLNRFHLEPRLVRVVLDVPRVVPGTEKTRVLPGPDERAFHQESRKRDPSRDAVRSRTKVVQAGRVTWPVVSRGDLVEDPPGDRYAGQYLVGGEQVVVLAMRQRTDEGAA